VHAFEILGDPVRRRVVELLAGGEQAAGEVGATIQHEFGISQPAISQHLRVLRENGFATVRAGQTHDAIFCMGGGYYPRLLALDLHLRGTLPDDYDSVAFHLDPNMRPTIERGSAAMAALLEADAGD
jgi:DNA-binding transcriptional ArsR family regulator